MAAQAAGRAGWEATGESARPMPGKPVPCWQWLGARARLIRTPPDPLGRPGTALPSRQEEPTSTRVQRPAMGRRSWASWAGSWAPPTPRGAISVPCCNLLIWGRCQSITVGIAPLSSQAAGLQSRLCHTQAVRPVARPGDDSAKAPPHLWSSWSAALLTFTGLLCGLTRSCV